MFVAVVLVAHLANHHTGITSLGAYLYFWGRVGYLIAAAAGWGLVRSMLCWNVALCGILLFVIALLVQ